MGLITDYVYRYYFSSILVCVKRFIVVNVLLLLVVNFSL